ncbi:hypothetical protein PEQA60_22160 [Pseudomonas sp. Eqa60]|uniref:hypothetical protein n=1 Tax=Pseudomonas sp. Eqa60 TaxID=2799184 RepID=UPI001BB3CE81|nr:hypothetical protein [Pseudomonas sp. Eqa60]BCQ68226.1 hypothetical protein PEQA60_22160 [Pseudomonas sp. Eqa60]
MATVYEVTIDGGSRVEFVKGERAEVDEGILFITDESHKAVGIFAKFDSVIAKPTEQE